MALKAEFILTLLKLKGFGPKTVLELAGKAHGVSSIDDLHVFWSSLKGRKEMTVTSDQLDTAYDQAKEILHKSEEEGIGTLGYFDEEFPDMLRNCTDEAGHPAPPPILFYRGDLDALKLPAVAVIGTREPTPAGITAGMYISSEIARRGFNVVSGLAKGCDTTGHRGALAAGGITTAFLAGDLLWDSIYPEENLGLAKDIVSNGGLLLSEYHVGQRASRFTFVARDRLQAGLSRATVIVQTGTTGGTMHAANATVNSGKPLYAVSFKDPAELGSDKVQGNLKLISEQKAIPLRSNDMNVFFSSLE